MSFVSIFRLSKDLVEFGRIFNKCFDICRINYIHVKLIGTYEDELEYSYGMMMERPYCLNSHHVSTCLYVCNNWNLKTPGNLELFPLSWKYSPRPSASGNISNYGEIIFNSHLNIINYLYIGIHANWRLHNKPAHRYPYSYSCQCECSLGDISNRPDAPPT